MKPDPDAMAGALQARPGHALPSLHSTRREWAPLVARGRPARALPTLLSSLYSLCGGAHRVAASLAVAAAQVEDAVPQQADRLSLQADTLREHLRRMWMDWPRAHPGGGLEVAELSDCPLLHDPSAIEASRPWIESHVLGMPAADWMAQWESSPQAFVDDWSAGGATAPARWLHAASAPLAGLRLRPMPLAAHASRRELEHLADGLRRDESFALKPLWRGHTAETGPWTRLADPLASHPAVPYAPVAMRLASRVADVARLAAPGGEHALSLGAATVGHFEGLAWCEMARGLLIHWVRLDMPTSPSGEPQVAACRVVAPTEWNFHPFGAVARLLATLPANVPAERVRLLAAAFDPCVDLAVETDLPAPSPEDACTR